MKLEGNKIFLENNKVVECIDDIVCSIEMKDRIIVVILLPREDSSDDSYRNIFCYSKQTGELLWQVDNRNGEGGIIEDVFVGMSVVINQGQDNKEFYSVNGLMDKQITVENFDLDKDILRAFVFSGHAYQINPRNGKATFLYQGK